MEVIYDNCLDEVIRDGSCCMDIVNHYDDG